MSFSSKVKEELSKQTEAARHCKIAELAAILSANGRILPVEDGGFLYIRTENETVSRKCFTLLKKTFNISTEVAVRKSNLKRGNVYSIAIENPKYVTQILETAKMSARNGQLFLTNEIGRAHV